jgi:hypothetical protein
MIADHGIAANSAWKDEKVIQNVRLSLQLVMQIKCSSSHQQGHKVLTSP